MRPPSHTWVRVRGVRDRVRVRVRARIRVGVRLSTAAVLCARER